MNFNKDNSSMNPDLDSEDFKQNLFSGIFEYLKTKHTELFIAIFLLALVLIATKAFKTAERNEAMYDIRNIPVEYFYEELRWELGLPSCKEDTSSTLASNLDFSILYELFPDLSRDPTESMIGFSEDIARIVIDGEQLFLRFEKDRFTNTITSARILLHGIPYTIEEYTGFGSGFYIRGEFLYIIIVNSENSLRVINFDLFNNAVTLDQTLTLNSPLQGSDNVFYNGLITMIRSGNSTRTFTYINPANGKSLTVTGSSELHATDVHGYFLFSKPRLEGEYETLLINSDFEVIHIFPIGSNVSSFQNLILNRDHRQNMTTIYLLNQETGTLDERYTFTGNALWLQRPDSDDNIYSERVLIAQERLMWDGESPLNLVTPNGLKPIPTPQGWPCEQ